MVSDTLPSNTLSLEQVIRTHNGEYVYLYSGGINTNILSRTRELVSRISDSLYYSMADNGFCMGQVYISISSNQGYVVMSYFEKARGFGSGRPFMHWHAIIVDQETYISRDLSVGYFVDKFIKYSDIAGRLHTIQSLGRIEVGIPTDTGRLYEDRVTFIRSKMANGAIDQNYLKSIITHLLLASTGNLRGQYILTGSSIVDAIKLADAVLALLPPVFRAKVSILAGAISGGVGAVDLVISSARGSGNRGYGATGGLELADRICGILVENRPVSDIANQLLKLHRECADRLQNYYRNYYKYFGDDVIKFLLDREFERKALENKRKELLERALQAIRNNYYDGAQTYYSMLESLGLLRRGPDELPIATLLSLKTGFPSLQQLFKDYGEVAVLNILQDPKILDRISNEDLEKYVGELSPICERYGERYKSLCEKVYRVLLEIRGDLKTLCGAYLWGRIKENELVERYFRPLDELRGDPQKLKNKIREMLIEFMELKRECSCRSIVDKVADAFPDKLTSVFIEKHFMHKSFKIDPRSVVYIFLDLDLQKEDSVISLLKQITGPKHFSKIVNEILIPALRDILSIQ